MRADDSETRVKTVYFVRHGESETNILEPAIVGGKSSWAELTPLGMVQARALGRRWVQENFPCDRVVSSTAIRALQTTRYCLEETSIALQRIETFAELEELGQGTWTGRRRDSVYTPEQSARIDMDPWRFAAPNGESQADVFQRVVRWLEKQVLAMPYEHTWVFCHGMVIKTTLTGLLGLDRRIAWRIPIDNASLTILAHDGLKWSELRRNDTAHGDELPSFDDAK